MVVVLGVMSSQSSGYVVEEFVVCDDAGIQSPPSISDNIVVWGDSRNGGWDVYSYDLSTGTEFAITTNQSAHIATTETLAIDGDIVVWSDIRNVANNDNNTDIYGYNLSTNTEFPISTTPIQQGTHVAVNGDTVAWVQWKGSDDYDIYGYNLSTQTEFPISTAPGYQYWPVTNGEVVVWSDLRVGYHTGGENWDIYGYDLSTQTEFQITTANDHQERADISGNIVVWQDDRNRYGEDGTLHDIYGYDLDTQTEFAICTNNARQERPSISGSLVVWMDDRNGDYDIYGYDLLTQTEFAITTGLGDQMYPSISGNTVVWEMNGDIYGARIITEQLTYPPDADPNGPYTVFVGDPLTLDGSGSTDPDNDIVSYMWDLDDDDIYETDAGTEAMLTVDYAYLESLPLLVSYEYTIHLKVTDSEGQSDIAETTLIISPKPAVKVSVDIKPGGCPNPLNTKSSGVLPVAILGSADLDVTTIDPTSILLSGVQPIRSSLEDVGAPLVDANDCDCTELGPDGILDLTLKFDTQKIVETFDEVEHGDIRELQLTGILYDPAPYETPIEGADCIVIKGKHKPINKADVNRDGLVNMADILLIAENWLQSSIVE